jgi:hypothetical protein
MELMYIFFNNKEGETKMKENLITDLKELVKLWLEGKEIQYRAKGATCPWVNKVLVNETTEIYFDIQGSDYRLKPEPRVIWLNEYKSGMMYLHLTSEEAEKMCKPNNLVSIRKFIEVLDESN